MRFLSVFWVFTLLASCNQSQAPFRNEVPTATVSVQDENPAGECSTSALRDMVMRSVRLSKRTPLAWLSGDQVVQFADFYTQIVPHLVDLVVDMGIVLDNRGTSKVFVMLFNRNCLVVSSLLEGSLFNEVMSAIGAEGRKSSEIERLIISSPPGFNI